MPCVNPILTLFAKIAFAIAAVRCGLRASVVISRD
jgi:hypothetical protein